LPHALLLPQLINGEIDVEKLRSKNNEACNIRVTQMHKGKVNITLNENLIAYIKAYAEEQRTTVSEILPQFMLKSEKEHHLPRNS
jgi:hypothetical protein